MSLKQVYRWSREIASQLPSLSVWQQNNVALFSVGIIEAESCQQRAIARKLHWFGKRESLERRQQRYVANEGSARRLTACAHWTNLTGAI